MVWRLLTSETSHHVWQRFPGKITEIGNRLRRLAVEGNQSTCSNWKLWGVAVAFKSIWIVLGGPARRQGNGGLACPETGGGDCSSLDAWAG